MTNLKPVTEGFNKFCGPAVLSILTGKSTDECAQVISRINGAYNVSGVLLTDLLKACDKLSFDQRLITADGNSLYRELMTLVNTNGMYIVTLASHFVCIEVKDKQIFFCDNHTKNPITAASSARLGQQVIAIHKVTEREKQPEPAKPVEIGSELKTVIFTTPDGKISISIHRNITFDNPIHNKIKTVCSFELNSEDELKEFFLSLAIHGADSE
jgi:hypothetical protein